MDFRTVEENLRDSFRALAIGRPAGEVREVGGVSIAAAGTCFQMFNAAFFSEPVLDQGDLERRAMTARIHFRQRGLPWSFWACDGLIPPKLRKKTERVFGNAGLRLAVRLPGMCAEQLLPPRRPLPPLEVRRVDNEATRLAFCDIGCICFHVPLNWFREIFHTDQLWHGGFVGYVGYFDGQPVATAATLTAAGAIGIYNVATLPAHRRRGHAEAVVRHAVEAAHRESGFTGSILQATEHGLRLYQSMGYRTVTSVNVYASSE